MGRTEAPPRRSAAGRRRQRSRGSHSTMWVAPSSAGRSSLTRRQRTPVAELGACDLEIHVGLAARFRDLAPPGADFEALAGIDPVIGGVLGGLVDRDDARAAVTLRVLRFPTNEPSDLVKVPRVMAMSALLSCSQGRPCDGSALGDRKGDARTASLGERPERSGGPRRGGNLERSGPRGGRPVRPGKFLSRRGWGRRLRIQRLQRHAGRACRAQEEASTRRIRSKRSDRPAGSLVGIVPTLNARARQRTPADIPDATGRAALVSGAYRS